MEADTELRQQEMERDNLQRIVSAVEAAIAASTPASRGALERSLQSAKAHLVIIEKKIKDTKTEIDHQKQEAWSFAEQQASRETKLNEEEKRNFAGFLKEDFFTKADFGRLEDFYKKTWDRLSEHGKGEMSKRVWEGVREGEYSFGELPATVREKEAKQAYRLLHDSKISVAGGDSIPKKDRQDFIRAYEAGKKGEAEKVLERESFKRAMFRGDESKPVRSVQATREPEGVAMGTQIAANSGPVEQKTKPSEDDLNLGGVQLGGLKMADAKNPPSSKDIPQNGAVALKGEGLLRGS